MVVLLVSFLALHYIQISLFDDVFIMGFKIDCVFYIAFFL